MSSSLASWFAILVACEASPASAPPVVGDAGPLDDVYAAAAAQEEAAAERLLGRPQDQLSEEDWAAIEADVGSVVARELRKQCEQPYPERSEEYVMELAAVHAHRRCRGRSHGRWIPVYDLGSSGAPSICGRDLPGQYELMVCGRCVTYEWKEGSTARTRGWFIASDYPSDPEGTCLYPEDD